MRSGKMCVSSPEIEKSKCSLKKQMFLFHISSPPFPFPPPPYSLLPYSFHLLNSLVLLPANPPNPTFMMFSYCFGFIALLWFHFLTIGSASNDDQYIYNYYQSISNKTITMKSINEQSLSLELDNFKAPHDSSSITTIIIRTIEARESLSMYLEQYLESQPWWRFQQWLKIEQEEIIVLERAPPSYESDMRDLIQSNYIPEHQCHSKFLDALYVSSDTW